MAKDNNSDNPVDAHKEALDAGVRIMFWLATLTLGEFLVAVIASPWVVVLWVAVLWKAFYVVVEYMHIGKLFSDEEAH